MKFEPYPHQRAGIEWIIERPACALLWGMGSMKTSTTLTALDLILHDRLEDGPVLVIAPPLVAKDTWPKEVKKWDHLQHLRVVTLAGTPKQRLKALETPADIYTISRDLTVWLVETVGDRWPFPIVVVDELSGYKSAQAKRFKALRRVRGQIRRIIGLTGTPRPKGIEDFWAEIYLLDQGERLGRTLGAFRARYLVPEKMNGHIVYSYRPKDGAEDEVYARLSDICMSVKKEDVIRLPGQEYVDIELTFPPALMKQYKKFEREQVMAWWAVQEAQEAAGIRGRVAREARDQMDEMSKALGVNPTIHNDIVAGSAAALRNKLLQFANGAIYDMGGKARHIHDIKLDALEELIEAACGDPVLVLYSFKHDYDRITKRIPCKKLKGVEDLEAWNRGEIPVAIAHPNSIGHGLNMQTGGHICIWFGVPDSLEAYQQANERLNRPGQKHVCMVYHLLMADTHDPRALHNLGKKEKGQDAAIEALRLDILKGEQNGF